MSSDLPCDHKKHSGALMDADDIRTFLASSRIFDPDFETWKGVGWEKKECIHAPQKFFSALMKHGARFYRPSRGALSAIVARALVPSFEEFVAACGEARSRAERFMEELKGNIKTTKQKIERANCIVRDMTALGSGEDVMSQFADIVK
jgi:hypothetical protein